VRNNFASEVRRSAQVPKKVDYSHVCHSSDTVKCLYVFRINIDPKNRNPKLGTTVAYLMREEW